VLAGVIAVLGTSVAFLSGESLSSFFGDVGKTLGSTPDQDSTPSSPQQPSQEQVSLPAEEQETVEESAGIVPEPAKIECEVLDVSGQYPVLQTGEECFKVSNVHTWVNKVGGRLNERSTTAFVVENTGTKTITIDSISARDIAVSTKDWFFTTDPTVVRPANLQKDLPVDYVENAIVVGGGLVLMKSDTITLEPGQAAIVYLNEAGGITEKDAGLILTLQVKAGKLMVEKVVLVVRA
jgi:hypothetical protein